MTNMNIVNIRTKGKESVIVTHHNTKELTEELGIHIKKYYRYADLVIACSYGARDILIRKFNI